MTFLETYRQMIRDGEVIVGYWVKKEVENLVDDLARYEYDEKGAGKRIKFMETCCLQGKAPYYMQPLKLMPWQKAWWEAVYAFRMPDGKRRFVEGLLEIARKNGKSTMLAADATYDLFLGEGEDICTASNDDRQARIIWSEVAGMRKRLDPRNSLTAQNLTTLRNKGSSVNIFRLSSKTRNKDGFNMSKAYLDESHDIFEENGQSEIAEAIFRGMSSQDEPLFLNSTTQGFNRECYLDRKLDYCKKVISGEIDDERIIAFLYEQDSEQEVWQDPQSWEKSNPAIRYGVKKIDKLRRDVEVAKTDKATRIHLLTKDFNIAQATAQGWLLLEDYAYEQQSFDPAEFRDAFCLGAVDLSATTDLTSVKALVMRPGDKTKYVISHYFIPESKLERSDDSSSGADYRTWAREGLITIHDGNEINLADVADWYYRLYRDYGIKTYKIGYDQRFARDFLERCDAYSFDTERIDQGRALSNAMKLTEADLKSRLINYNNHAVDRWCLGNTCIKVDNVENIMPVKARGESSARIDGGVTMIMIEEMYRRHRTEYMTLIGG